MYGFIAQNEASGPGETNNKAGKSDLIGSHSQSSEQLYKLELQRPLEDDELDKIIKNFEIAEVYGDSVLVRAKPAEKRELGKLPYVKNVAQYLPEQKLSAGLINESAVPGDITVDVTITLFTPGDKPYVIEEIKAIGGTVLDGVAEQDCYLRAQVSLAQLETLARSSRVVFMEEYHWVEFLNDRVRDITGASPLSVPGLFSVGGLRGENQTIGLADSGLDTGQLSNLHPDLKSEPGKKPRVVMLKSWAGMDKPADYVGHGTHMAGTLVGSGKQSAGKFAGLAPEASLYFQGIVNSQGQAAPPVNIENLYLPAYEADVRVHVNGWGRRANTYNSTAAQIDRFIRQKPDFLAIFGAGNFGPQKGTITAEANSKNALVVGATANYRPAFRSENAAVNSVAVFSSRGPTSDGRIKPDLLAPGTSIISTSSSLLEGNLPGRPGYAVRQGTSMASAVAGGATTLLRQYFEDVMGVSNPSAALLKASLINGADFLTGEDWDYSAGFGVINLTRTVVSLKESAVRFDDNARGVKSGQFVEYKYNVESKREPLKVTLVWTDPPPDPGAQKSLVNDLNLVVITPTGQTIYGNHHITRGLPDSVNNVEQVEIINPEPGMYTIRVYGESVTQKAAAGSNEMAQDFALVYGQPAVSAEVKNIDVQNEILTLNDGVNYSLKGKEIKCVLNNSWYEKDTGKIYNGSQVYMTGDAVYSVTRIWRDYGLKITETPQGLVWSKLSGNFVGEEYSSERGEVTVTFNGEKVERFSGIPGGFEVVACINPFTQNIFQAEINYRTVEGFVEFIDRHRGLIKLLNDNRTYSTSGEAVYLFEDTLFNTDPVEGAFGVPRSILDEKMMTGVPVNLVIAPSVEQVQSIALKRNVAVGVVEQVDVTSGKLTVSGSQFRVVSGAAVFKDDSEAALSEVKAGQLATLFLLSEKSDVAALSVYSNSYVGKISYLNTDKQEIYLQGIDGRIYDFKLGPRSIITKRGVMASINDLSSGLWVRVITKTGGTHVWQVSIADSLEDKVKSIESVHENGRLVIATDGTCYSLGNITRVYKDGYPLPPGELVPGDNFQATSLLTGQPGSRVALKIVASSATGLKKPVLNVSSIPFASDYWITGETTGKRLYLFKGENAQAEPVTLLPGGRFSFSYVPPEGGQHLYLVAVDGDTGSIAGISLNIVDRRQKSFVDLAGHWAEAELNAMARDGLISGYPNQVFMPDKPVTRVEFAAMLARAFGWYAPPDMELPFRDNGDIPAWARQSVGGAVKHNIVSGYPDGTFRPLEPVTRVEESAILARLLAAYKTGNQLPEMSFADMDEIPIWAAEDVKLVSALGIMQGRDRNRFQPHAPATRAETAVAIYRLLQQVRAGRSE